MQKVNKNRYKDIIKDKLINWNKKTVIKTVAKNVNIKFKLLNKTYTDINSTNFKTIISLINNCFKLYKDHIKTADKELNNSFKMRAFKDVKNESIINLKGLLL